MYARHEEYSATVNAPAEQLFAHLDDHTRLSSHMSERSWKMGWGKMDTVLDAQHGQAIGSHIVLSGRVFGIRLYLDEIVTLREPPTRKYWETVGEPHLLVVGPYRMGFDLTPDGEECRLRVVIDYNLPPEDATRWLGEVFGDWYARWCTRQMVQDARQTFARARESRTEPR